jgi:hypothetical protein
LRRVSHRGDDADTTLGDQTPALDYFATALPKLKRRIPDEQAPQFINLGIEVISGSFSGFASHGLGPGELSGSALFEAALDLAASQRDVVKGDKLNLVSSLSSVLRDLSRSLDEFPLADFSDAEIEAARNDVRNGFKLAVCLHGALRWMYGPDAFGLRTASLLGRKAGFDQLFAFVVIFLRLRRNSSAFLSSSEIARLAQQAEAGWLISMYFRDLRAEPKLAEIVDPKLWKIAFSDSRELKKLLVKIAGYEFPTPAFRPWDRWTTLSGKTMSPGLLAMSIGAPSERSLADIVQSASAPANP